MFLYVCLPIFYSTCCFVQSLYLFFNCCCLSWVRGRGASILYPKAAREPNQMIFISILRGHPLRKPMFFSVYPFVSLHFLFKICFFIVSFYLSIFLLPLMISTSYLSTIYLSICLSSYLFFLQTFCPIYSFFQYVKYRYFCLFIVLFVLT